MKDKLTALSAKWRDEAKRQHDENEFLVTPGWQANACADELDALLFEPEPNWQHANCHDLVCNGDRNQPRGTKGVTCSCGGRDTAYAKLREVEAERDRLRRLVERTVPFVAYSYRTGGILTFENAGDLLDALSAALAPTGQPTKE